MCSTQFLWVLFGRSARAAYLLRLLQHPAAPTSSAVAPTALLSVWFFDLAPTLQLFLGMIIACISLNLYFMPAEPVGLG